MPRWARAGLTLRATGPSTGREHTPGPLDPELRAGVPGVPEQPDERRLHRSYELGRAALADGVTLLDLVRTHHAAFGQVVTNIDAGTQACAVDAVASFLIEALAPYEMARRGYLERARDDRPRPGH